MNETTTDRINEERVIVQTFYDGDLGIYETYEQNLRRAEKKGMPHCQHCGRGIDINTAFVAFRNGMGGAIHPTTLAEGKEIYGSQNVYGVLIGSTCAKKVIDAEFLVPARDVDPSEINNSY